MACCEVPSYWIFGWTCCPSDGLQKGLSMWETPSEFALCSMWHMCGSFVLLSGLEAVVAMAAAEDRDEAFAVPFEAAVPFAFGSTAAVGTGAVAAALVSRSEASESFGCSAEKSPAELRVSITCIVGRSNDSLDDRCLLACRRPSKAADANPPKDRAMYTQKSIETQLHSPKQLRLAAMIVLSSSGHGGRIRL